LYVGTGEAYTSPAAAQSDSVVAFDLDTGARLWWYQARAHDAWNMACFSTIAGANCPAENGPDLDVGAPPIIYTLPSGKQIILGAEKSGDIFALDPDHDGRLLWRVKYGRGGVGGGVHWGMAASARTLYAPNADTAYRGNEQGEAKPGLFALEPSDGHIEWFAPAPDGCAADRRPACDPGFSAPPTVIPGVVFQPSFDGWIRAFDESNGRLLWSVDTARSFVTVSGEVAQGGSIDSVGVVVSGGNVLSSSGYLFGGRMPGNVLLVFTKNGL
jgi:polyvinyl alcohol dehydrogenase (cytochrome)